MNFFRPFLKFLLFGLIVYVMVGYWPIVTRETVREVQGELEQVPTPTLKQGSVEGSFLDIIRTGPPLLVEPIDRNGSIIIESIGVNSPIVFDVPVDDRAEYERALNLGVAHAQRTSKPVDRPGNTYLFAHSTANEANIARYAAVFTKLHQLPVGERLTLFYQDKRFDYEVVKQEVVDRFEVSVLAREYDFPALTLQTCDPPGQEINRRIVTAKLVGVFDE